LEFTVGIVPMPRTVNVHTPEVPAVPPLKDWLFWPTSVLTVPEILTTIAFRASTDTAVWGLVKIAATVAPEPVNAHVRIRDTLGP
jgi:hypothetical protein